ncbi:MAG: SMC-Scp complex subunit ScpB [Spirochaetia bacterium]
MDLQVEKALIEAVLFLESDPIDEKTLAKVSKLDLEVIRQVLPELKHDYDSPERGLELIEIGEGYQLIPKKELWNTLKERYGKFNTEKLSRAAMETLSIIAYSQPITRGEIENIRGVSADGMIRQLLSKDLIKEVGKKDAPGKPVQYGTTREFLKAFRLASIADLPKLDEVEQDRFELNG